MGIAPRRKATRAAAEHALEKALDAMHATKSDRVLARRTFHSLVDKPRPVTLGTATRKALQAVADTRAGAA